MKVYFEDNEKMGEIAYTIRNKEGSVIIVSTEDGKIYRVKLDEKTGNLLEYTKYIQNECTSDISGIIIKTNDVEEIPVGGKRRETGIIEDYMDWTNSKVPIDMKISIFGGKEFINNEFPKEYEIDFLSCGEFDDYDATITCNIVNKYSDKEPFVSVYTKDHVKSLTMNKPTSIRDLLTPGKTNKIRIRTSSEVPFLLDTVITVKKFKYNK